MEVIDLHYKMIARHISLILVKVQLQCRNTSYINVLYNLNKNCTLVSLNGDTYRLHCSLEPPLIWIMFTAPSLVLRLEVKAVNVGRSERSTTAFTFSNWIPLVKVSKTILKWGECDPQASTASLPHNTCSKLAHNHSPKMNRNRIHTVSIRSIKPLVNQSTSIRKEDLERRNAGQAIRMPLLSTNLHSVLKSLKTKT